MLFKDEIEGEEGDKNLVNDINKHKSLANITENEVIPFDAIPSPHVIQLQGLLGNEITIDYQRQHWTLEQQQLWQSLFLNTTNITTSACALSSNSRGKILLFDQIGPWNAAPLPESTSMNTVKIIPTPIHTEMNGSTASFRRQSGAHSVVLYSPNHKTTSPIHYYANHL